MKTGMHFATHFSRAKDQLMLYLILSKLSYNKHGGTLLTHPYKITRDIDISYKSLIADDDC